MRDGWTLEDYIDDYERKIEALGKIVDHHQKELLLSQDRQDKIMVDYVFMLRDVADDLWWQAGELRDKLENRESIFYIVDQKERNKAWSEWVNLQLQMNRLEKRHRELMDCLYP